MAADDGNCWQRRWWSIRVGSRRVALIHRYPSAAQLGSNRLTNNVCGCRLLQLHPFSQPASRFLSLSLSHHECSGPLVEGEFKSLGNDEDGKQRHTTKTRGRECCKARVEEMDIKYSTATSCNRSLRLKLGRDYEPWGNPILSAAYILYNGGGRTHSHLLRAKKLGSSSRGRACFSANSRN